MLNIGKCLGNLSLLKPKRCPVQSSRHSAMDPGMAFSREGIRRWERQSTDAPPIHLNRSRRPNGQPIRGVDIAWRYRLETAMERERFQKSRIPRISCGKDLGLSSFSDVTAAMKSAHPFPSRWHDDVVPLSLVMEIVGVGSSWLLRSSSPLSHPSIIIDQGSSRHCHRYRRHGHDTSCRSRSGCW